MSEWEPGTRRVDAVILTAIRLEFDAVLEVDAGAVPGSTWKEMTGPDGLPVAFRSFLAGERPLRVAVAVAPDMGATAAVNTLLPLVDELEPGCIAMCGVCAGRRGKVQLGDVVAADRLYYHDAGKQRRDRVDQDLKTYNLRDDWKTALEAFDPVARFRDEPWFQARPISREWREHRALVALHDGAPEPWRVADPALRGGEWPEVIAALRERNHLAASGRAVTADGRRFVDDLLLSHMGALPDLSPSGSHQPFRLHVAPIGSGARVIEDEEIWSFVSLAMRKTLGIEMEATAVAELAHRHRRYQLDWVVMKGVMDFADHGRDDHFKQFAARASAECLLQFLRDRVATELRVGFDDLLTPGTSSATTDSLPPSSLLLARHTVVPWHDGGRFTTLEDLDAWADDPQRDVAVQLLHAAGGVGKTRLAIEWVRRRRARHDVAGFLVARPDSRWLERLCGLGPSVLIVIDYAERRADLVHLLERVAAFAMGTRPRRRVRLLLLARSDGDWWTDLRRSHGAVGGLLTGATSSQLTPLAVTPADREVVFREAAARFATVRDRQSPRRPPIAFDDVRFERVLYIHMAALAAVEGAEFNASSLMDVILDHEEQFWVTEAHARHAAAVHVPLARQMMAAATLRGALTTEHEAREMIVRLTRRPRTSDDDALIALLHDVYARSNEPAHLPGLEPDLLGEAMVLRVARPANTGAAMDDQWIDRVFDGRDSEAVLTTALVVMGRASVADAAAVRPWILRLLDAELSRRAVLALRAAKIVAQSSADAALGDLLAEALASSRSAVIAVELDREGIPTPTVSLSRVALWRSQRLYDTVPEGDTATAMADRAATVAQKGVDYHAAGQYDAALIATQEAADLYRSLAKRDPDTFEPLAAASQSNLGNVLSDLGRHQYAVHAARAAEELYRKLEKGNPSLHRPDLARTLNNLGATLSALGDHERALHALREAVGLYHVLERRNSQAYRPALAMSLTNLGAELSEAGKHDEAVDITREALELYEPLARSNRDAFQPEIARCHNNLGMQLSRRGQHDMALAATLDAVEVYRRLARRSPDAFRADLAKSLNNLGKRYSDLGRTGEALAATRDAVAGYRSLVHRHYHAFLPGLALSLNNFADQHHLAGEHDAALAATREAVGLYRALATRNPDTYQRPTEFHIVLMPSDRLRRITVTLRKPDEFQIQLAETLTRLASRLSEREQLDEAIAVLREAIGHYDALGLVYPSTFRPRLARSLNHLGDLLSASGRLDDALAAVRKALELLRRLAARTPEAYRADLAGTLHRLGNLLSGQRLREALDVTREAAGIYRALAADDVEAYQPELARCLSSLSSRWSAERQQNDALDAALQASELFRRLAASKPDAFLPEFASSLNILGLRLRDLWKQDASLVAMREAVSVYRELDGRRSLEFRPGLAASLNNLGMVLDDLGQHDAAVTATREAVELRRELAAKSHDAAQPLAASLGNLGTQLGALGQPDAAVQATSEAVAIYRRLALRNPDGFRADLARNLYHLGIALHDLGDHDAARVAIEEANYGPSQAIGASTIAPDPSILGSKPSISIGKS